MRVTCDSQVTVARGLYADDAALPVEAPVAGTMTMEGLHLRLRGGEDAATTRGGVTQPEPRVAEPEPAEQVVNIFVTGKRPRSGL